MDEVLDLTFYQVFALFTKKKYKENELIGQQAQATRMAQHANEKHFKEFLNSCGIR